MTATATQTVRIEQTDQSEIALHGLSYPDPLDDDRPDDEVITTTRRGIARVALVATEVANHFQRKGVAHEPMAWMLAPRMVFGGAAAIDACIERDACIMGVMLHSLAIGVDAEPEVFEALLEDGDDDDMHEPLDATGPVTAHGHTAPGDNVISFRSSALSKMRLFSATVVANDGFETIQAFHASLSTDEAAFAERLHRRLGHAPSSTRVFAGFDPSDAMVIALVSEAMCNTLAIVAVLPTSPIAAGLDVNVEQRFFA